LGNLLSVCGSGRRFQLVFEHGHDLFRRCGQQADGVERLAGVLARQIDPQRR
jgi:hypothetical protein